MTNPQTLRALLTKARAATDELRDAARLGRFIEFRQRDPLVLVIHQAFDRLEALLASEETPSAGSFGYCAVCYHPLDACSHCDGRDTVTVHARDTSE